MKNPPLPMSVLVCCVRAARTYALERRARIALKSLQRQYDSGAAVSLGTIGFATMSLWAAEALHREAQERYREMLRRREGLPAADRWSVKDLETWAAAVRAKDPAFMGSIA